MNTDTTTSHTDTTTSHTDTGADAAAGHTEVIDTYLSAYGEPDPVRRRTLIESAFVDDAVLADPPFMAAGQDELHATFAAVQEQFPGHRFRRCSDVDEHHDAARYRWSLDGPDGSTAVSGTDYVLFSDGKITRVTGFFGDQAAS